MRSARRAMKAAFVTMLVTSSLLTAGASPVLGFCTEGLSKWSNGHQTLWVRSGVPPAWANAITGARSAWNGIDPALLYASPVWGDSSTSTFNLWYRSFSALGWDTSVPARTLNTSNVNPHVASNIYMNSDWTWNTTGLMDVPHKKVDVRTILTHEIGHSTGLAHPDCDGVVTTAERAGVMWANGTKKWVLTYDDRSGVLSIYP